MKACSAAIVILAGALTFTAGAFVAHDGTQLTVMFAGALVGLLGLAIWWKEVRQPQ